MRAKELSERSGTPLSSIKFWIREGLLPAGSPGDVSNQAEYDDAHLARIRLIRALREVGRLPTQTIHDVLGALDHPESARDAFLLALAAAGGKQQEQIDDEAEAVQAANWEHAHDEVRGFLLELPWSLPDEVPFVREITDAIVRIRRYVWPGLPVSFLEPYARAMWELSAYEFEAEPPGGPIDPHAGDDLTDPVRMAFLSTILFEPILLALRRFALYGRGRRRYEGLPMPAPRARGARRVRRSGRGSRKPRPAGRSR